MTTHQIAAVLVALLTVVSLAGAALAQPAGTLVVGLVAEPVNLDPAQVTDFNSNRVGRRIAETLVTFPEEKTEVVPGLAESWTISKKRAAFYRQAQKILVEDAPWIFVDHEVQIAALSKRVQGFKLHPSFDLRVETISLK